MTILDRAVGAADIAPVSDRAEQYLPHLVVGNRVDRIVLVDRKGHPRVRDFKCLQPAKVERWMTGFQFAGLIVKRPGNHGEIAALLEQREYAETRFARHHGKLHPGGLFDRTLVWLHHAMREGRRSLNDEGRRAGSDGALRPCGMRGQRKRCGQGENDAKPVHGV